MIAININHPCYQVDFFQATQAELDSVRCQGYVSLDELRNMSAELAAFRARVAELEKQIEPTAIIHDVSDLLTTHPTILRTLAKLETELKEARARVAELENATLDSAIAELKALVAAETVKTCSVNSVGPDDIFAEFFECSLCNNQYILSTFFYCPNCGAKIEKPQ